MFFKLDSFCLIGIKAIKISVEVHLSNGLPSFTIVGLPDKSINESRLRVRAAITSSGFKFPNKRIIVNLAPADLKKEGVFYDLPIALALMTVNKKDRIFNYELINKSCFIGELSLNGNIKAVRGIISMAENAARLNKEYFFMPEKNCRQAAVIRGLNIVGCKNFIDAIKILKNEIKIEDRISYRKHYIFGKKEDKKNNILDFSDVKGQLRAKRAIEIAVSGMHNVILIGPPGSGKTMIAKRITGIMPGLDTGESIEVTKIYSLIGKSDNGLITERPFRNPHHTITRANLIGGGISPKPGEISLAHRGILFLDEFPQFKRSLIEDLRQPLENREITIARKNTFYKFPCSFILVVAANPCPCGYYKDNKKRCVCSNKDIKKYWDNISGPILDRIDIRVEVPRPKKNDLISKVYGDNSPTIRKRVLKCHRIQGDRFKGKKIGYNSEAGFKDVSGWLDESKRIKNLMPSIIDKYNITGRGFMSLIKISRTIADMENSKTINISNIMEAINYRINLNYECFK